MDSITTNSQGVKVKITGQVVPVYVMKADGEAEVQLHLFFSLTLDGYEQSILRPRYFSIRKEPQYPINRRPSWLQSQTGGFWRREKYLASAEIRTSDCLPTATRYTDYDIPAPNTQESTVIKCNKSKRNSPVLKYRQNRFFVVSQ